MGRIRVLTVLLSLFLYNEVNACKYTIREIGYSTLSKVTYVLYRVDDGNAFFSKQIAQNFAQSNVVGRGLSLSDGVSNPVVKFVLDQKLTLPAYVLAAPDGRMLTLTNNNIQYNTLNSPIRKQLLEDLPVSYASVIFINGKNEVANVLTREIILKANERIENILPNMPKQVNVGPNMIEISNSDFEKEKVLLWSFGITEIPEQPMALVIYGKGRIMGEKITYEQINEDVVYKYLAIIGADCECGLDRKWMLGYQMPLNWPTKIRQGLSDDLGFDVDNPMVLTEMSRILATENKVATDPGGVSFEPIIFDLDKEFGDVPEVPLQSYEDSKEFEINTNMIILISILLVVLGIGVGAYIILKRKN